MPTERPHLVDAATGTPLCPEAEYRDSLSDEDFWVYVLTGQRPDDPDPDCWDEEVPDEIEMQTLHIADPCPECGEVGACAVDAEGRALIHVTEEDPDADT